MLEHIGTCGIELYFTDNVAVQYNEVSDVVKKGGGADDNAIDPDWRVTNALIQYNYVHNAGEGFLLCGVQFNSGVVRYNLVQDCGRSYIHYSMGSGYFQIYNNVFYRSKDGNGTSNFDPWGGGKAGYFNNVFYDGKGTGFNFSGGSSFSYNNNAYYGTKAPGKDANPIILTEDPFEGSAPSLERKGSFASGVLLEANGLRPKTESPLVAAGVTKDPNGISIEEGLKEKGGTFNFTPLASVNSSYFGGCIPIERTDYPTFEKTGAEATFDTNKTQTAASDSAPTIGMFEADIDENAVILRGKVTDGINPLAGAEVEVKTAGGTVTTTTNDSGSYSILEGLEAGEATVTVKRESGEATSVDIKLEKGKVNICDVKVALVPMPEAYEHTLISENFDGGEAPQNFLFDQGSEVKDGKLVITKDMGNAASAVSSFDANIKGQKAVDFSFDWSCERADKMGFEFRDSYGRLLFAVCAAPLKNEVRTSTTGGAVDAAKAASAEEPKWSPVPLDISKTYTIRVHADFEEKMVSYQVAEKGGDVLVQQLKVPTDAVNLAQMNACSWWASKPQYIDNFELTAPAKKADLPLEGKTVYAFGDSIVAGHQYEKASFANFTADKEGMKLSKFAVNGSTIMDAGYSGGQILAQLSKAPQEAPDYVLFDGGTNDAEYIQKTEGVEFGTAAEGTDEASFDTATFAGAFEKTVFDMKQKWPEAQLVYVAVHKLGSRDNEIQNTMHDLEMQICRKWGITVANIYEDAALDTNDTNQKNNYTFDNCGSNGLPGINGSGTHPNLAAIEEFYVPLVSKALREAGTTPEPETDKNALQALYNEYKDKEQGSYTEESWKRLLQAMEETKKVLEDPDADQESVDTQLTALLEAVDALEEKIPADKTALEGMIALVENLNQEEYTESTWNALQESLTAAKAVMADENADQDAVDTAFLNLTEAFNSLVRILNTVAAQAMIEEAESVLEESDKYRPADLEVIAAALQTLKDAVDALEITQEELDELTLDLQSALMNLREQVDAQRLQKAAVRAQTLLADPAKYTADSAAALKNALEGAQAVLDDGNRTQEQVADAYKALTDAMAKLQPAGNRELLVPFIERAQTILAEKEKYTEKSLEGLAEVLDQAETVYGNTNALQKDVEDSVYALATELAQVRILGDVNADGVVNTADAALLLKANAELIELDEESKAAADVNRDKTADTADAAGIEKYAAELIEAF